MGSLAIDGLISGLNTTDLINKLMSVEAQPQTLLKNKVSTTQTLVSAFQSLNTSVASLASYAKATALPTAANLFTASSSAPSVTVTAGTSATPGQIDLSVTAVAKAQVSVTAAINCRNCDLGKYVPQKNGLPSGVRKQVIGQPPCPVMRCSASM